MCSLMYFQAIQFGLLLGLCLPLVLLASTAVTLVPTLSLLFVSALLGLATSCTKPVAGCRLA